MLISNYVLQLANGLPQEICEELISSFDEEKAFKYDTTFQQTYIDVDLRERLGKYISANIGDYLGAVPKYVHPYIPASSEVEHIVIKKLPKGKEQKVFFDNYGTPKRRLQIQYFLNNIEEGGAIHYELAGLRCLPKQGEVVLSPYSRQYASSVSAPSEDLFIMETYMRIKDEN